MRRKREILAEPPAKHVWAKLVLAVTLMAFIGGDSASWERCPSEPREIFSSVTYGCERLERTAEGHGVFHWVRVDLGAPGIGLYLTQLDPVAAEQGWQYRLRWIGDVVTDANLAVAVNGSLFTSRYEWWRLPGTLANGVQTVVSNHVVSHWWYDNYLLWFDDDLNPHLRPSKPPTAEELRRATWGIGGQNLGLHAGHIWSGNQRVPDARTAVGIDTEKKLLFLAVAEWASPHLMFEQLARIGARDGFLLDGGGSSGMAIGEAAQGLPAGTLFGGSRPVATFLGVSARPLTAAQGG